MKNREYMNDVNVSIFNSSFLTLAVFNIAIKPDKNIGTEIIHKD
ncbi:MAG: hypothetical protein V5A64_05900 [Candidatus Thermoplasmatota archaeon]